MIAPWLGWGLLCAVAEALKDITSKQKLRDIDALVVAWSMIFLSPLFLLPLLVIKGVPELGENYFPALIAHGTLYGSSVYLYMKAIQVSRLSVSVPLIMFTPVFMLATSPLMLGEFPSSAGLAGVLLIVGGSYFLNIKSSHNGFFGPFKALLSERGPRLMLVVALIWSLTSTIDKVGITNSEPIFWGVTLHAFIAVWMFPFVLRRIDFDLSLLLRKLRLLFPVALFNGVQLLGYVLAMEGGLAVYALSIKRTSVLIVILLSRVLFKERGLRGRLAGAAIMFAGVLLISFG